MNLFFVIFTVEILCRSKELISIFDFIQRPECDGMNIHSGQFYFKELAKNCSEIVFEDRGVLLSNWQATNFILFLGLNEYSYFLKSFCERSVIIGCV